MNFICSQCGNRLEADPLDKGNETFILKPCDTCEAELIQKTHDDAFDSGLEYAAEMEM